MNASFLDLGKRFAGLDPHARTQATVRLARAVEEAGGLRYWIAEHHVPDVALHAPEVALALVAGATERLRVGAAGVLLRYYSPLKVWETYLTLAAAFPGRIDLGVARGPGVVDDAVALELVSGQEAELAPDVFESKVRALHRLGTVGHPTRGLGVAAGGPALWLLGSNPGSAVLARDLGVAYGYMGVLPRAMDVAGDTLGALQPRSKRLVVALSVACAATSAAGHDLDRRNVERGLLPSNAAGSVPECEAAVRALLAPWRPDEVVLCCLSPVLEHQLAVAELVRRLTSDPV